MSELSLTASEAEIEFEKIYKVFEKFAPLNKEVNDYVINWPLGVDFKLKP